jgi:hypothetical protein
MQGTQKAAPLISTLCKEDSEIMKKLFVITAVLLIAGFIFLGGCSFVESRVARWTTDFNVLPSDNRILYEDGAEKVADEVSRNLNNAMRVVESRQFGKFDEPVKVYAFASPLSFSKFSGISDKARGASVDNEIYLSGLMMELPDEVYGMVCHELSHVQLTQVLGVITFNRTIPRWFREGLAIYVSDGGGAPRNYEKETIDMFLQGKHFIPEVEGSLINRSFKATAPIGPRMLYSQSGMFVKYLANTYPDNFQILLFGIQKEKQFEENFKESFGNSVADIFQSYIKTLRKA